MYYTVDGSTLPLPSSLPNIPLSSRHWHDLCMKCSLIESQRGLTTAQSGCFCCCCCCSCLRGGPAGGVARGFRRGFRRGHVSSSPTPRLDLRPLQTQALSTHTKQYLSARLVLSTLWMDLTVYLRGRKLYTVAPSTGKTRELGHYKGPVHTCNCCTWV